MGKSQLSYGNVHEENKLQDYTRKRGGLQFFFIFSSYQR